MYVERLKVKPIWLRSNVKKAIRTKKRAFKNKRKGHFHHLNFRTNITKYMKRKSRSNISKTTTVLISKE